MQTIDKKIDSKFLLKAFELMNQKKLDEAEKVLDHGLQEAESLRDLILTGLYHSAYGVLYKLRKDFRKAWKYYEKAEKLIPEDPALKIISSRLLVEYFGQYDTVIRKMDKVIKMVEGNLPFLHQALCLKGLAFLRKGNKKRAVECLKQSMGKNFEGLESVANLDFKLLQELIKKKGDSTLCRQYLEAAQKLAKKTKETGHQQIIQSLLGNLSD